MAVESALIAYIFLTESISLTMSDHARIRDIQIEKKGKYWSMEIESAKL